MSFRLEEKIKLHISDLNKIKVYLTSLSAKELFPQREISSVYFDNKKLEMYLDSEEGSTPRKKIRVRQYPNDKDNKKKLETKITSVEGKFKVSKDVSNELSSFYFKRGFFDHQYGMCYPIIKISYTREYWILNNSRLTIDYNINYKSISEGKNFDDRQTLILELKASNNIVSNLNLLNEIIPLNKQRFSKYCEGINSLFNLPFNQRLIV